MIENLLRKTLKEAQEKAQYGLLIWASWRVWDEFSFNMKEGNENYEIALSHIERGETTTIDFTMGGFYGTAIFAVQVEKLHSSTEYFESFVNMCREKQIEGPITLVPSNEVSEIF